MRIPIGIENNYSVCRLKIKTQTTGPGWQKEEEVLAVFVVEFFQQISSILWNILIYLHTIVLNRKCVKNVYWTIFFLL